MTWRVVSWLRTSLKKGIYVLVLGRAGDVSQLHPVVLALVPGHQNRCRPFLGLCPVGVPQVAVRT